MTYMTTTLLFTQYEARLLRRQASPKTVKALRQTQALVERLFPGRAVEEVEPWEWEEAWDGLEYAHATKATHLAVLRAVIHYAQKRGVLERDPTRLVELPPPPHREPEIMTSAELRAVRDRCRTELHVRLWHALVFTGMRQGEIASVRWEAVNLRRQIITVIGKGDKERRVPIHPAIGELLADARCHLGRRVFGAARHETLASLGHNRGCHIFRRTVASSLARNGVAPHVIDAILGWAPRTIANRHYVRVADDELVAAICRLYCNDPV